MAISQAEIESIREWARMNAREMAFQACKEVLAEHIKSCPHGQSLAKALTGAKWLAVGIGLGVSLVSGTAGFALAKWIGSVHP